MGNNGIGKTNLLDAIYYTCFTKSYFQSKEANNIQSGKDGFRIESHLENDCTIIKYKEAKKKISFNNKIYDRAAEHIGTYTAIMIAPDDISLINGASEVRRKFMDSLLSQSDKTYLEALLQYQKLIQQRNAYLKQTPYFQIDHTLLDIYDEQIAPLANYIFEQRSTLSEKMPSIVQRYYQQISDHKEHISIQYESCMANGNFYDLLVANRGNDIQARRTTVGIHTEDWTYLLNENPCKAHASQGQKKSLLIALKLAHLDLLKEMGKNPFLLLDDIFEKLDKQRMAAFFNLIKQLNLPQVFITHTDFTDLNDALKQHFDAYQIIDLNLDH